MAPKFTEMLVTPAMAAAWIENNLFEHQRPLRPTRVRYLAQLMRGGHFRRDAIITFAVWQQRHYLIDGQHTLHAIVVYGQPVWLMVQDYYVSSAEEIGVVYGTFDRNLTRQARDVMGARDFQATANLSRHHVAAFAAAMPYAISGLSHDIRMSQSPFGLAMQDPELRLTHMRAWLPEAQTYFGLLHDMTRLSAKCFERAAVVGVALITIRHQRDKAKVFWDRAAHDDGLTLGTPEKTLVRFLHDNQAFHQRDSYPKYIAHAWNAYMEGRKIQRLSIKDHNRPAKLVGTPVNGRDAVLYATEALEPLDMPRRLRD